MARKFFCQLDWVFKKLFSFHILNLLSFSLFTTGSNSMFLYLKKKILVENKLTGLT